jgi:surface antigen
VTRCGTAIPSAQLAYQHYDPPLRQNLIGAGLTYDPSAYFLTADANYTKSSFLGSAVSWYASGGARFGELTPYAFYASTHANAVGSSGLTDLGNEHTVGAGLRWDFARNFDGKLQLERVTLVGVDDTAAFANIQPDAHRGDKANVVSVAVDFVF